MKDYDVKSDLLLLLTALIWGFAFSAQRIGMEYVGPFTFNGVRFALGASVLLPFILLKKGNGSAEKGRPASGRILIAGGVLAGTALFAGASLQQVGLVYTTAGKAGFITGLYVVIVPILGLFIGKKTNLGTWTGAILAAAGMYLLCVTETFSIAFGDFLELIGAFMWALHMLIISWISPRADPLKLAAVQYSACSILSLLVAFMYETVTLGAIMAAYLPILYGGGMSVGIAYTLQVVAQQKAHPAHAAILLSLESVFAALGGWIILGEVMSSRGLVGCALMFVGMLASQLYGMNILPRDLIAGAVDKLIPRKG